MNCFRLALIQPVFHYIVKPAQFVMSYTARTRKAMKYYFSLEIIIFS